MEAYTEHDAAAEAADGKRRDYGAADVAAMFPKAEIIKDICGIERVVAVRG